MEIAPGIDTGVSTISENIQDLLSKKDYSPSYTAKLINRAIEEKRYKSYPGRKYIRRGHFIELDSTFLDFRGVNAEFNNSNRKIIYPNFTMPSAEGQMVMVAIDKLVEKYSPESLDEDSFYNLLAAMVLAVGAAHVFPDGTGRTAVGLADVFLRKYKNKSLDLNLLQSRDDELTRFMIIGSVIMFPGEYAPNEAIKSVKDGGQRKVEIPNLSTHTLNETQSYAREFAKSIISKLDLFNPKILQSIDEEPFSLKKRSVEPIAKLLKDCTK